MILPGLSLRSLVEEAIDEAWSRSERRKRAGKCSDPKGFTMKQFCRNQKTRSRKGQKTNEDLLHQLVAAVIQESLLVESFDTDYPVDDLDTGEKVDLWISSNPRLTDARAIVRFIQQATSRAAIENVLYRLDKDLIDLWSSELRAAWRGVSARGTESSRDIEFVEMMVNLIAKIESNPKVGAGNFINTLLGALSKTQAKALETALRKSRADEPKSLERLRSLLGIEKTALEKKWDRVAARNAESESRKSITMEDIESAVTDYVMDNITLPIEVRDGLRRILTGASPASVIRGVNRDTAGEIYELIQGPDPQDGGSPYVYRGIRVPADSLKDWGVDPDVMSHGKWVNPRSDHDPDEGGEDDPGMESWEAEPASEDLVPVRNPPGANVSSWTYSRDMAKRFAGNPAPGWAAIVLEAHVTDPNAGKFLNVFRLYQRLDLAHGNELEVLGVASDSKPVMASVTNVKLG